MVAANGYPWPDGKQLRRMPANDTFGCRLFTDYAKVSCPLYVSTLQSETCGSKTLKGGFYLASMTLPQRHASYPELRVTECISLRIKQQDIVRKRRSNIKIVQRLTARSNRFPLVLSSEVETFQPEEAH